MPALFDRDEKGREGLLNFRLVGNFIVVDQVPRTLVMRLGKDEAVLINRNPPKTIRIAGR
jgi:type IV secretion system protein VirB9